MFGLKYSLDVDLTVQYEMKDVQFQMSQHNTDLKRTLDSFVTFRGNFCIKQEAYCVYLCHPDFDLWTKPNVVSKPKGFYGTVSNQAQHYITKLNKSIPSTISKGNFCIFLRITCNFKIKYMHCTAVFCYRLCFLQLFKTSFQRNVNIT